MNRLKKRAWLPKVWALVAIGLALASQACSNTCADYESAINNCGGSFNRQKCDQNIGQCTSADIKTIENAASCMQNPSVCSNGKTVDVASILVTPGQEVRVRAKSREIVAIQAAIEQSARGSSLSWLAVDKGTFSGRMLERPSRPNIPIAAQEQLVVELYSK